MYRVIIYDAKCTINIGKDMKSLIKELEIMGQTQSLKQFSSVKQMIESGQSGLDLVEEAFKNSQELICAVEPLDDKE